MELMEADQRILEELREKGRSTPSLIAEEHGYSAGHIRNRFVRLNDAGLVERRQNGVYELPDSGE